MPSTPDIDVSALAEALNEKLDRDGYNATNDIKEMMANMGSPSDKYINLSVGASGASYTAPADGLFTVRGLTNNANGWITMVNDTAKMECSAQPYPSGSGPALIIAASKGDQVRLGYSTIGSFTHFRFIYANGSQHLASN